MAFVSPLRYPGGKSKIANFIKYTILQNNLKKGTYIEPYAGGAGIACELLLDKLVNKIIINDADLAVYSFWYCVKHYSEELCKLINNTPVNMQEWLRQQQIQKADNPSLLELGFSTFFLNRTNVSGILKGGVIGGKDQKGNYLIDARFNKDNLIARIKAIAKYTAKIELYNENASDLLKLIKPSLTSKSLIYFDPPYYEKGQRLYRNFYEKQDHKDIATQILALTSPWIVSYDNVEEIKTLYPNIRKLTYNISYSAKKHYAGNEIIFFSNDLIIPNYNSPIDVKRKNVDTLLSVSV